MISSTPSNSRLLVLVAALLAGCGNGERSATPGADSTTAVTQQPESVATEPAAPRRLARDTTFFQEMVWSPDGSRLLLSRLDMAGGYRSSIAVVDADATSYGSVTDGPQDMWATWSPDGRNVAYASTRGGNRDIYRKELGGREEIRLTEDPDEDTHPAWSPDGSRILYVTTGAVDSYIVVMNADGTNKTVVNDAPGFKWNPRWSPDGSRITYYAAAEAGSDLVYVMNADGTGIRALGPGVWPGFSPDGSSLLYVHGDEVRRMALDGSGGETLFDDAVIARWSPDGRSIAFVRVVWRHPEGWPAMSHVFIARPDGSRERRITGYD